MQRWHRSPLSRLGLPARTATSSSDEELLKPSHGGDSSSSSAAGAAGAKRKCAGMYGSDTTDTHERLASSKTGPFCTRRGRICATTNLRQRQQGRGACCGSSSEALGNVNKDVELVVEAPAKPQAGSTRTQDTHRHLQEARKASFRSSCASRIISMKLMEHQEGCSRTWGKQGRKKSRTFK